MEVGWLIHSGAAPTAYSGARPVAQSAADGAREPLRRRTEILIEARPR